MQNLHGTTNDAEELQELIETRVLHTRGFQIPAFHDFLKKVAEASGNDVNSFFFYFGQTTFYIIILNLLQLFSSISLKVV